MDLDLQDRSYIITGGSRGLGLASATVLVQEGAQVLLVGRSQEHLDVAKKVLGSAARVLQGDLADADLPDRAIGMALDSFGRLDGALVSVGGPPAGSVLTIPDAQWQQAFETVFLGAVRMTRHVCVAMMEGLSTTTHPQRPVAGVVGMVLSVSARQSLANLSVSNAFRPGLAMLISDLADEIGPVGLRAFGLMPGRIATSRLEQLDAASPNPGQARQQAEALIPLRRYGTPLEFGRCAAFLLSPAASYISGTCIAVDGGLLRMP